jgi:hypothetical protein
VFLAMSAVTTLGFDFSPIAEEKDRRNNRRRRFVVGESLRRRTFAVSASTATIDVNDAHDSTEAFRRRSVDETVERGDSRTSLKKIEQDKEASRSVASQTWRAVSRPKSAATFLAFLVMSASMAVTDTYLFLWMEQLGASRLCMGVALGFTCLSEVVVFKKEAAIKNAISTEQSIALILFCYAARQWFYAAMPFLTHATPLGAWIILPGAAPARHHVRAVLVRRYRVRACDRTRKRVERRHGRLRRRERRREFPGIGARRRRVSETRRRRFVRRDRVYELLTGVPGLRRAGTKTTNTKNTPGEVRHATQTPRSFFATFRESFRAKKTFFFANRRGAGWRPVAADEVEMRGEI